MMLPFYIPKMVNSGGLLCDIVGAFLIWRYTLPPAISKTGEKLFALEDHDDAEIEKAKRYDWRASLGFGLLIFGFALQLLSNWL